MWMFYFSRSFLALFAASTKNLKLYKKHFKQMLQTKKTLLASAKAHSDANGAPYLVGGLGQPS